MKLNGPLDKRGVVTLPTKESAEDYLRKLPQGYNGSTFKTESGGWGVRFHRNTTDLEASILLRLARAGVHPTELDDRVAREIAKGATE